MTLVRALAFVALTIALDPSHASAAELHASSDAERAYARTVAPLTAGEVTANLRGVVGKRVRFVCSVVSVVDAGAIVGQCGKEIEPVDLYVHLRTGGLKIGDRLRVLGEMETPSMWVDVTGHPWLTGFVRAAFVDRL